jgi:hypothetical protein
MPDYLYKGKLSSFLSFLNQEKREARAPSRAKNPKSTKNKLI